MKRLAPLLALALAAGLVSCGESDETTTATSRQTPGGQVLEFEADPDGDLAYTVAAATAKAGEVTIEFENSQSVRHIVEIADSEGRIVAETPLIGERSISIPAELKPGTYAFFCPVEGHREAGMEGTLTVQ